MRETAEADEERALVAQTDAIAEGQIKLATPKLQAQSRAFRIQWIH